MKTTSERVVSYLFILPALALVVVLLLVPMLQNIYYSFFDWDGLAPPVFTALKNYADMFADRVLARSMLNTVLWVAFTLLVPVMGGLLVAVFVAGLRLENLFKIVYFSASSILLSSTFTFGR